MKDKIKQLFTVKSKRAMSNSAMALGLSAVVLVLVVAINLLLRAIPVRYTRYDVSESQLYTLGGTSYELIQSLEQPVDIYYLAQEGAEDTNVKNLLERYQTSSSQVHWETVDPAYNPSFASEYGYDDATEGSLLVVSGERSRLILPTSFYQSGTDEAGNYTIGFDAEQQITSAIRYVISTDTPKVYRLTGHGEAELDSYALQTIQNQNLELVDLSLVSSGQIPEDTRALILNAPMVDYTQEEVDILRDYLELGGSLVLVTDGQMSTPNLAALLEEYGITLAEGYLSEGNSDYHISGLDYYLLPDLGEDEITEDMNGRYVLIPYAQGALINENTVAEVTPLLITSDKAVPDSDPEAEGTFLLSAVSGNSGGGAILWVGGSGIWNGSLDSVVSGGNSQFLVGGLSTLCGQADTLVISSKSLQLEGLVLPESAVMLWGCVFTILIPLALIGVGIAVTLKRRRQ